MAQTTTSMRRGNAGEETRGAAPRTKGNTKGPRGNAKSQRGNTGGTQRRAPRRDFGRLTKLPSGKYRARYLGPDGQLYNAPRTFVARIDAEGCGLTPSGRSGGCVSRPVARGSGQGDWSDHYEQQESSHPGACLP